MQTKIVFIIALGATLLSGVWFVVEPGFEPLIAFLLGLVTAFGIGWNQTKKAILRLVPELVYVKYKENGEVDAYIYSENAQTKERKPYSIGARLTNLSEFSVTLSEIGFLLKDSSERIVFSDLFVSNDKSLPTRLEPRESVTYTFKPAHVTQFCRDKIISKMYAKTDCGCLVKSANKALKSYTEIKT